MTKLLSAVAGFFGVSVSALAWLGVAAAVIAAGTLVHTYDAAQCRAARAETRAETSEARAEQAAEVVATERADRTRITAIEVQGYVLQNQSDQAFDENVRLAAAAGGLRDPGRKPAAGVPRAPAAACPAADPAADGRLSEAATRFLLDFAHRADDAANYAGTGHAYAETVKARIDAAPPAGGR